MNGAQNLKGLAMPESYLVREEPIRRLERIVFALWEAARRGGPSSDKTKDALRVALSAQCARCGMRVTGDELIGLSQLPAEEESDRIQRLRKGCCAREGCKFGHYQLEFKIHPDLDWAKLLSADETLTEEQAELAEAESAAAQKAGERLARRRLVARVGILIVIALVLFVLRQLYLGGRIPLIREPEKFRVDPAPPGGERVR